MPPPESSAPTPFFLFPGEDFRMLGSMKLHILPVIAAGAGAILSLTAQDREYDASSFTWNPALSPTGPVVVSVNLETQTAAVYRNGIEIGTCLVSTGRKGYETPTGVFHILQKDADHHSATYGNAAMPYTERLTWGGVALHAGGLPGYPSSHGCVHLPFEFSKRLFAITELGGTVIITKDAPTGGVSEGHRIEFTAGEASPDMQWMPHDSPAGPVSILFSSKDKEIVVVRNGVPIGKAKADLSLLAEKPHGTYAYVFAGWGRDGKSKEAHPQWHQIGGPSNSHEIKAFQHIKTDERMQHILETVITPGTNLVITNESVTDATRTQPGFHIMTGTLASAN